MMTTWCCGDILLSDMSWEVWGAGWTGMRPYKSLSLPFKVFFFVMCSYIFKRPFSQSEDCNHCHHLRSSLLPNCLKQPAAICLPHYRRRHWQLERPRRPIIVVGVLMAGGRGGDWKPELSTRAIASNFGKHVTTDWPIPAYQHQHM